MISSVKLKTKTIGHFIVRWLGLNIALATAGIILNYWTNARLAQEMLWLGLLGFLLYALCLTSPILVLGIIYGLVKNDRHP